MTREPRSFEFLVSLTMARGLTLALLGFLVVRWPGDTMLLAILAAGAVLIVTGVVEILTAVPLYRRYVRWWLAVLIGVASMTYGLLTLAAPAIRPERMVTAGIAWCLAACITGLLLAVALSRAGQSSTPPLVWAAVHLVAGLSIGLFALRHQVASTVTVLYAGSAYAAIVGVAEITLAVRWRRSKGRVFSRRLHDQLA